MGGETGPHQCNCVSCPVGRYHESSFDVPAPLQCKPFNCPAGNYLTSNSATSAGVCTPCEEGQYQQYANLAACGICPAGKYAPDKGQTSCTDCECGRYQPNAAQTSCILCAAGRYGLDSLTAPASTNVSHCSACAAGRYEDSAGGCSAVIPGCKSCPTGWYSETSQGITGDAAISCTPHQLCAVGRFLHAATTTHPAECEQCAAGQYQHQIGQDQCIACEYHPPQYSTCSQSCDTCVDGVPSWSGTRLGTWHLRTDHLSAAAVKVATDVCDTTLEQTGPCVRESISGECCHDICTDKTCTYNLHHSGHYSISTSHATPLIDEQFRCWLQKDGFGMQECVCECWSKQKAPPPRPMETS